MTLLKEIVAEIIGMFVGDARLTLAVLVVVGTAAAMVVCGLAPLGAGGLLLAGCLLVLIESVWRGARPAMRR
ncbi:MAG TPA: hypothetical protein VE993_03035 [Stellaceae bacterium]|nr:hypothetical protein [Stellaceae bacterium]